MTTVRIPPPLRTETLGEAQVRADGETVRAVLDDVVARFPSLGSQLYDDGDIAPFVRVYLDGEDVRTRDGLDTEVRHGATLILLPAMAGGRADG